MLVIPCTWNRFKDQEGDLSKLSRGHNFTTVNRCLHFIMFFSFDFFVVAWVAFLSWIFQFIPFCKWIHAVGWIRWYERCSSWYFRCQWFIYWVTQNIDDCYRGCYKSFFIFMEDPTLGLDARVTYIVMRAMWNIVDTGRKMIFTIHELSIDIFEAFDEVNLYNIYFKWLLLNIEKNYMLILGSMTH